MKKKIDQPKVFISYAWGTKEHDANVLAFASKLVNDGIEVVLDKWDMSEGNDTYSFMERSATDPTITNVLMLIDPVYANKADTHTGGVGTETQIISTKVYQEVNQDKFIPIVFERGENGEVCKPTYLQGRLHFDLTIEEKYDDEYQRLVRTLYGVDTYIKPQLGTKPLWVDKPASYSSKSIIRYDELKQGKETIKEKLFRSYLNQISDRIIAFAKDTVETDGDESIIQLYNSTQEIRNDFLLLMKYVMYIDEYADDLTSFFEETANNLYDIQSVSGILAKIFLHEIFIYTIACLWNDKDYVAIGLIFGKTYFTKSYTRNDDGITSYQMFYSGSIDDILHIAVKNVDKRIYYSGVAKHWISNIAIDTCSKDVFVFADLLCYNYAVYGKSYLDHWKWFPLTYCYDDRYNSIFTQFAKKLVSKAQLQTILPIFGFDSVDEFVQNYKSVHSDNQFREYKYNEAFESAKVLGYITPPNKIGTLP